MSTLTHKDAELVLKLYELRREAVMRESRDTIAGKFWPKTFADIQSIMNPQHPSNAAYRQVTSYWEMTYGFARRGIIDPNFLIENNGEGLFVFARFEPFLADIRTQFSPLAFSNTEWISKECEEGRRRFEILKKRVQSMMPK